VERDLQLETRGSAAAQPRLFLKEKVHFKKRDYPKVGLSLLKSGEGVVWWCDVI